MLHRQRLLLLFSVLLLLSIFGGLWLLFANDDQEQLLTLRSKTRAILKGNTVAIRQRRAIQTIEIAEPLIERDEPLHSTASLYVVAAAPVADYAAGHIEIPPVDMVKQVATEDLLILADLLFHTKRFGSADQLISIALLKADDPLRAEVLTLASVIRIDLGRDQDVLVQCDELIEIDPTNPTPYKLQAAVHRNHGRWDQYVPLEKKVVELTHGSDGVSHVGLVDGYLHLGKTGLARAEFDKLSEHFPELVPQAPTMHARLLMQENKNQEAAAILLEYIQADSHDAEALVLLGTLQVGQGAFAEAVETLQRAISVSPAEEKAYYQLGQAYARMGETEKGQAALNQHRMLLDEKVRLFGLEQQAAREPLNVDVRLELAESYHKIGINKLAEFWLQAAEAAR